MDNISTFIIIGIILVVIILISFLIAKQYRKVGPNEALIISGGRKRTVIAPDGTKRKIGYRYRLGGGTFVLPFPVATCYLQSYMRRKLFLCLNNYSSYSIALYCTWLFVTGKLTLQW